MNGSKRLLALLAAAVVVAAASPAKAFGATSLGAGITLDGISSIRLEVQKGLGCTWFDSPNGYLSLSLDGSTDYWWDGNGGIWAFSAAPLLTYHFTNGSGIKPFVEGGIGTAFVSGTHIEKTDSGIQFQFEDILGASLRFGTDSSHGLRLRILHYSNGGLDETNDGITFYTLSYHYRF